VTANLPGGQGRATTAPAGTHRVVAGDTLSAIARTYGTTVAALREANGITGSTIRVGQLLTIPGRSASTAPSTGGSVTTTIGAGSEVALVVSSARIGRDGSFDVSGAISSRLTLEDLDLRTGSVETKILGLARASLDTTFRARRAAGGRPELATGTIRIPVRIEINAGSKVKVNLPGRAATDITMDRNGSYAEFTAIVKVEGGRPRVEEMQRCDLYLISNAAARLGGDMITIGGEKSVRFQGRISIKTNGLDLFGDITVRVHGNDREPIVSIRW
jgi:murein DD-endopeptidase MepM/ murein hydrolase activator NlpD